MNVINRLGKTLEKYKQMGKRVKATVFIITDVLVGFFPYVFSNLILFVHRDIYM